MSKVKQKQIQRRTEIIEAAVPIISRMPFEDISIAEICGEIGISVGSFYHYFTKKNDLLIGMLWLIDEDLQENVFPRLICDDEMENLKIFAHGWAEHVHEHGIDRSKLITGINPEITDLPERERPSILRLEEIISRGQEKGQISKEYDCHELVELFVMTLRGVTTDWSRRNGSYSIVEKMDRYIAIFLRAFRP
jgi:AcrR family transcriptional regulator